MSITADQLERTATIRALNDDFRRTFQGGRILLTPGVLDLQRTDFAYAMLRIQITEFCDFENDNDPYHEHDFGALGFAGHKVFWKIDYYDLECCYGSPDPTDPKVTTRVMTIMLASEY